MTRKSEPGKIIWTPQSTQAFSKLKEILLTAPIMMNTDFSRLFILQTDASEVRVGAVLSQTDTKGYDHHRPQSTPMAHKIQKTIIAFQFQVQHRKGNDNANTDALSKQTEPDEQSKAGEGGGV